MGVRVVGIALETISCDSNGFGGVVQISGDTFAATFNDNPENVNDQRERKSVFPFPNGPIGLSEGHTHSVKMGRVLFTLKTEGGSGPPDLAPKFLKFGGALNNGLGSNFHTIRFDETLPVDTGQGEKPKSFPLVFATSNLTVKLTFGLIARPPLV
jgi:hypothetical protein